MEEAMFVHIGQSKHGLEHDGLDLLLGERGRPILHKLINVLLHEFKYEVQVVVDSNNLLQFHYLTVVQFA